MKKYLVAAAFATALIASPDAADAQSRTEVGTLTCTLAPTVGALVASRRRMDCRFVSTSGTENYAGTLTPK